MNALARTAVFRRGAHTLRELIPPNIGLAARKIENEVPGPSTAAAVDAVATEDAGETTTRSAADFDKLVDFYKRLPKGTLEPVAVSGPFARYKAKYIETGSFTPIIHVILLLLTGGYSIHYFQHIRYHKNAEHH